MNNDMELRKLTSLDTDSAEHGFFIRLLWGISLHRFSVASFLFRAGVLQGAEFALVAPWEDNSTGRLKPSGPNPWVNTLITISA